MYHQTTLVGRVGNEVEQRFTPVGIPVANFNVAVNRAWTDNNGEQQERTYWYRITTWRGLAETCAEYLTKGRQVMVIGSMEDPYVWVDEAGNPHGRLEMTASIVKFLGNRPDSGGNSQQTPPDAAAAPAEAVSAEVDEDIPF